MKTPVTPKRPKVLGLRYHCKSTKGEKQQRRLCRSDGNPRRSSTAVLGPAAWTADQEMPSVSKFTPGNDEQIAEHCGFFGVPNGYLISRQRYLESGLLSIKQAEFAIKNWDTRLVKIGHGMVGVLLGQRNAVGMA